MDTIVVGSGAAGLNCACVLLKEMERTGVERPEKCIAVVTESLGSGTSNNAGSDKQTYYKLGTYSDTPDTAVDFAEALVAGGCTHGDNAFIEGVNSLRCFHRLVELGVPFPHDAHGEFPGYRTDHDPRGRGTSAGPWTSRSMVRKLIEEAQRCRIPVFERHYLLAIITTNEGGGKSACGILCVDMDRENDAGNGLVLFRCRNIVVAGGGPGDLYEFSVYPKGQMAPYAALFDAGVEAVNLTELQFGIASLDPRWNLSGSYQQVIPRYYSTSQDGGEETEFLNPWFESMPALARAIFLKGYEWPFDTSKVENGGSSIIDILVYNETVNKGRRVFVDFRENPRATENLAEFDISSLDTEVHEYLEKSDAIGATPIERLVRMNQPGVARFTEAGRDLRREPLETGVCAQHCNGGFAVDGWWETGIRHLFVVGELAGTHGVKRPGGAALNAGQVGGMRAAQRIAHVYYEDAVPPEKFTKSAGPVVDRFVRGISLVREKREQSLNSSTVAVKVRKRMSRYAGMVRSNEGLKTALKEAREEAERVREHGMQQEGEGFLDAMKARDLVLAELGFLEGMCAYMARGGGSRGSSLVLDPKGALPHLRLGDQWRFLPENTGLRDEILGVTFDLSTARFTSRVSRPRPVPRSDLWFEHEWSAFQKGEVYRRSVGEKPKPYADVWD
jgi:succinate dehydrogenase/fumarate reductase flavoprotein subunit